MSCRSPLDIAVLADYWLAALPEAEETAVEEHLLDCDECGTRLRELIALEEGVRQLAREGALRLVVNGAFLSRAAEQGLRIREYAPPAGGTVQCTVSADDDLLIARLAADLRKIDRVDLLLCDAAGQERIRLADIPVDRAAGEVVYQESMAFGKASATQTMIVRLVGVDAGGSESLLGEYTFNHTRSLPGPGITLGGPA